MKLENKTKRQLKKHLWKIFSRYIRQRDKGKCFTCNGEGNQAGHYRTGATCNNYLYFDERNVNCQCFHCNINLSGNWRVYQQRIHYRYGQEIDEVFDRINQKDGWDYPFIEKIKEYEDKLRSL